MYQPFQILIVHVQIFLRQTFPRPSLSVSQPFHVYAFTYLTITMFKVVEFKVFPCLNLSMFQPFHMRPFSRVRLFTSQPFHGAAFPYRTISMSMTSLYVYYCGNQSRDSHIAQTDSHIPRLCMSKLISCYIHIFPQPPHQPAFLSPTTVAFLSLLISHQGWGFPCRNARTRNDKRSVNMFAAKKVMAVPKLEHVHREMPPT